MHSLLGVWLWRYPFEKGNQSEQDANKRKGLYDLKQMKAAAAQTMALHVWAVFLAALSNFSEITADLLLDFSGR